MAFKAVSALLLIAVASTLSAAELSALIKYSDAIVLGAETSPVLTGTAVTFDITIERAFAGPLVPGQIVVVTWDSKTNRAWWWGSQSYRGIWFLKKDSNARWNAVPTVAPDFARASDLFFPVAAGSLPTQLAYDDATTALGDKLVLEIASGQYADPGRSHFRDIRNGLTGRFAGVPLPRPEPVQPDGSHRHSRLGGA